MGTGKRRIVFASQLAKGNDQIRRPLGVEQSEPCLIEGAGNLTGVAALGSRVERAAEDWAAPFLRGGVIDNPAHQGGARRGLKPGREVDCVRTEVVRHDYVIAAP